MMISRVLGWISVAAIITLSIVPGDLRPQVASSNQIDHFAAYFVTALLLALGYFETRRFIVIALTLTALAAGLEIAQLWVPGRMARVVDFAGGALGTWIAIAVAGFVRRVRRAVQPDTS